MPEVPLYIGYRGTRLPSTDTRGTVLYPRIPRVYHLSCPHNTIQVEVGKGVVDVNDLFKLGMLESDVDIPVIGERKPARVHLGVHSYEYEYCRH